MSPLLLSLFITCVKCYVIVVRSLLDNMNLYIRIDSIEDCWNLQNNWIYLYIMVQFNKTFIKLYINAILCLSLEFVLRLIFLTLSSQNILRSNGCIIDLNFKLNSFLILRRHIEIICCKAAFRMLDFIMRLSNNFRFHTSLKVLYCVLIQPVFEYGRVIWDPCTVWNLFQ